MCITLSNDVYGLKNVTSFFIISKSGLFLGISPPLRPGGRKKNKRNVSTNVCESVREGVSGGGAAAYQRPRRSGGAEGGAL